MSKEQPKHDLWLLYREERYGGHPLSYGPYPDREDEYIDFSLLGAFVNNKDRPASPYYEHVYTNFPIEVGDPIWVLVVRYTTGDTFGWTLHSWHILGAFARQEEASQIASSIEKDTYKGYAIWKGCFESFENCEIERLVVEE